MAAGQNKTSRQSEQSDLPVGHIPVRESPTDVVGMRQLVGVLVLLSRDIQSAQRFVTVIVLVVIWLQERDVIAVDAATVSQRQACHELMRFRYLFQ